MNMTIDEHLVLGEEVRQALHEGRSVVALESTIISHGMPHPENVRTALMLEQEVREQGAVPATIAILEGKIWVGLSQTQVEEVGSRGDFHKVSRRDIPYILAMGLNGATTVASTMIFAQLAGIPIFATGGIGGVHRGAGETFDISADLTELANTDVAVVCAGVKSILDIGLTLEKLETLGVPVIGYGTEEFPAFYTRKSGFKADYRVDEPAAVAKLIRVKRELAMKGGMVIANPIPIEFEPKEDRIGEAVEKALAEAKRQKIKGKETTPFLLKMVKELTGGESLASNIALVRNNARLAAQIAVELAEGRYAN